MITRNRVALHLVTLGEAHDPRHLLQKVKAAAAAGFQNIGLQIEDVEVWVKSDKHLRELNTAVKDQGLQVIEIGEVPVCDERGRVTDQARAFAAAEALCAPMVAVVYNGPAASLPRARDDWAKFLDLVSDAENISAALHFKGDAPNFNTLDRAWDVVSDGPENGCLLLDVYDFWRGQSLPTSLEAVPMERVGIVHLADVRNVPREKASAADRTFPGAGIMPLTHIVSALNHCGYAGLFSVEVLGDCQRRDCAKVAQEAFRAARRLLGTSGPSHRKLPA